MADVSLFKSSQARFILNAHRQSIFVQPNRLSCPAQANQVRPDDHILASHSQSLLLQRTCRHRNLARLKIVRLIQDHHRLFLAIAGSADEQGQSYQAWKYQAKARRTVYKAMRNTRYSGAVDIQHFAHNQNVYAQVFIGRYLTKFGSLEPAVRIQQQMQQRATGPACFSTVQVNTHHHIAIDRLREAPAFDLCCAPD
jgi:hypothetical protein